MDGRPRHRLGRVDPPGAATIIELQATGYAQSVFYVMRNEDIEAFAPLPCNMAVCPGVRSCIATRRTV